MTVYYKQDAPAGANKPVYPQPVYEHSALTQLGYAGEFQNLV